MVKLLPFEEMSKGFRTNDIQKKQTAKKDVVSWLDKKLSAEPSANINLYVTFQEHNYFYEKKFYFKEYEEAFFIEKPEKETESGEIELDEEILITAAKDQIKELNEEILALRTRVKDSLMRIDNMEKANG